MTYMSMDDLHETSPPRAVTKPGTGDEAAEGRHLRPGFFLQKILRMQAMGLNSALEMMVPSSGFAACTTLPLPI